MRLFSSHLKLLLYDCPVAHSLSFGIVCHSDFYIYIHFYFLSLYIASVSLHKSQVHQIWMIPSDINSSMKMTRKNCWFLILFKLPDYYSFYIPIHPLLSFHSFSFRHHRLYYLLMFVTREEKCHFLRAVSSSLQLVSMLILWQKTHLNKRANSRRQATNFERCFLFWYDEIWHHFYLNNALLFKFYFII